VGETWRQKCRPHLVSEVGEGCVEPVAHLPDEYGALQNQGRQVRASPPSRQDGPAICVKLYFEKYSYWIALKTKPFKHLLCSYCWLYYPICVGRHSLPQITAPLEYYRRRVQADWVKKAAPVLDTMLICGGSCRETYHPDRTIPSICSRPLPTALFYFILHT